MNISVARLKYLRRLEVIGKYYTTPMDLSIFMENTRTEAALGGGMPYTPMQLIWVPIFMAD